MIVRLIILFLGLILIPGVSYAEFYKYVDENGVTRFTDNLLDVPKDQRKSVKSYTESVTPDEEKPAESAKKEDKTKGLNKRSEELNAERELLAKEFAELDMERKELLKNAPEPQEQEAYEAHVKKVEEFNARIQAYEAKRKVFQEKVDEFNAIVEGQ